MPEIQNGVLLKKTEEAGFEVLITMDSNMTFQLNLEGRRLKIVVLRARSNRLADTIIPCSCRGLTRTRRSLVTVPRSSWEVCATTRTG